MEKNPQTKLYWKNCKIFTARLAACMSAWFCIPEDAQNKSKMLRKLKNLAFYSFSLNTINTSRSTKKGVKINAVPFIHEEVWQIYLNQKKLNSKTKQVKALFSLIKTF